MVLVSDSDVSAGAEALVLDAAGAIDFTGAKLQARPGGGAPLGIRAGGAVRLGTVEAGLIGGWNGTQVAGPVTLDAGFSADDVTASDIAVSLTTGDLAIDQLTASGSAAFQTDTGKVSFGTVDAGTLNVASGGSLTAGSVTAQGAAMLAGSDIAVDDVTAGSLTIRTDGTLAGRNGGRTTLTSTRGDLSITADSVLLTSMTAARDASIDAGSLNASGKLSAARRLLVSAREALTLADAHAGDSMDLQVGGALVTGALDTPGALTVAGAGVKIASATVGGTMALTSTGDLRLDGGSAGGAATLSAQGLATVGALTGGPSIAITAGDMALTGRLQASAVTLANATPAAGTFVGDGVDGTGLQLSAAELNQVAADSLRIDGGSGAMAIGTAAIGEGVGRTLEFLSTGTSG